MDLLIWSVLFLFDKEDVFTASRGGWGWKVLLEATWSDPCPGRDTDRGPRSLSRWIFRKESPQPLWAACAQAPSPTPVAVSNIIQDRAVLHLPALSVNSPGLFRGEGRAEVWVWNGTKTLLCLLLLPWGDAPHSTAAMSLFFHLTSCCLLMLCCCIDSYGHFQFSSSGKWQPGKEKKNTNCINLLAVKLKDGEISLQQHIHVLIKSNPAFLGHVDCHGEERRLQINRK